MSSHIKTAEPLTFTFDDDGLVPNNPLPLVIYRGAFELDRNPEQMIEKVFGGNDWHDMWRDGVFKFLHFHSMIHEAMGVARGRARIRFGGNAGKEIEVFAGDATILPAGTGHQCLWASDDFSVVGAYPKTGTYNLVRPSEKAHVKALVTIPEVPRPAADPVFGKLGPLAKLWSR